jgi:beta-glucosidase
MPENYNTNRSLHWAAFQTNQGYTPVSFPSGDRPFPKGFLWGAATAAFQIEGYPLADGAGESIWHRFVHTPGKTECGDTGDGACDHYHRWREDIKLMAEFGLKAYRFSISWCRIIPNGTGRINQSGVDFYNRLIDELLRWHIRPMVTLFHWDYPQALQERGGLGKRESAEWFGEYAALCFQKYSDRVKLWLTLNEPEVFTTQGHSLGVHAPGLKDRRLMVIAGHNLLRGHGRAVQALRAIDRGGKIGVAFALAPFLPREDTFADRFVTRFVGASMRRFCDPILLAEYPPRFLQIHGASLPKGFENDLKLISEPVDLIGCNYYTKWRAGYEPSTLWPENCRLPVGDVKKTKNAGHASFLRRSAPRYGRYGERLTPTGQSIYPVGLYETLIWARKRYGNYPMYITENNAGGLDRLGRDGRCHDAYRIAYLRDHFRAARQAIADGVDLRGYMVWTLMDNLEWAAGFRIRLGLLHTDFATQRRTWKDSARWYRNVIKHNRVIS